MTPWKKSDRAGSRRSIRRANPAGRSGPSRPVIFPSQRIRNLVAVVDLIVEPHVVLIPVGRLGISGGAVQACIAPLPSDACRVQTVADGPVVRRRHPAQILRPHPNGIDLSAEWILHVAEEVERIQKQW